MVRANSALIIALGDLLTLDLEPCSSSPISQSSTTIASVSLSCSPIAVSDPLASRATALPLYTYNYSTC